MQMQTDESSTARQQRSARGVRQQDDRKVARWLQLLICILWSAWLTYSPHRSINVCSTVQIEDGERCKGMQQI